jgi:hypothetical protein
MMGRHATIALLAGLLGMPIRTIHAQTADTTDAATIEEQKREFEMMRGSQEKWGPRQRPYDRTTVQTITGTVTNVDRLPGRRGNVFVQLNVKTASETIGVFLGPERYVEQQPTKIKAGDAVTVTGSRIRFRQRPLVLAAEVKKGAETLALRDAKSGTVKWPPPPAPPSDGTAPQGVSPEGMSPEDMSLEGPES